MNRLFRTKPVGSILLQPDADHAHALHQVLRVRDLAAMGIAAIVGAGIFSTIGDAASSGGPGVSLLFVFTAIACGFSALCYAQFASMVPVAGSAYTYSYVAFGELIAWIIGWDLILEYAIGNVVVAISWSEYFTTLLEGLLRIDIPAWLTESAVQAKTTYGEYLEHLKVTNQAHLPAAQVEAPKALVQGYEAWNNAPQIGGWRIILDLPAVAIVGLITWLVFIGMKDSRNINNLLVLLKLLAVGLVIAVGAFFVAPENWSPFAPNGMRGILGGISAVFFAYIGFDAIATTSEECRDPQRDMPRGIIWSLVICTILYILIALVLTGMVPYDQLDVDDPLAFVFQKVGLDWMSGIVAVSAVIAMAGVLLVFQLGQPRIWMSMSRDGLLPPIFSRIHPRHRTPSFSTWLTGLFVAVPIFLFTQDQLVDLTSIGTLFAFVLVCGGIIVLEERGQTQHSKFKVPYINSRYWLPAVILVLLAVFWFIFPEALKSDSLSSALYENEPEGIVNYPLILFWVVTVVVSAAAILRQWSIVPVLGLVSCLYLMSELGMANWTRFVLWLVAGLVIYFLYGMRKSKLAAQPME